MIFATTPQLTGLSQTERNQIAELPRNVASHDVRLATLSCMNSVEVGGTAPTEPLGFPFTVAAWNLERCLFPTESAVKIATSRAQVVLLSEMDNGMARTAQAHTTAAVASTLGMVYAYGVEFIELGLGSETELEFCTDNHNRLGFHGNAVLAATPLVQPFLLRLPGQRFWFLSGGDQSRLGERLAIGAVIQTEAGPVVMVSTHLESNADAAQRETQLCILIDSLEATFPSLPLLIGGDLNTGNHIGGDWRDETLFAHATRRGFMIHGGPETAMTTRASQITRWPNRAMKLDWFLTRGLQIAQSQIIASTDKWDKPLSDHDMIVLQISGLNQ